MGQIFVALLKGDCSIERDSCTRTGSWSTLFLPEPVKVFIISPLKCNFNSTNDSKVAFTFAPKTSQCFISCPHLGTLQTPTASVLRFSGPIETSAETT